MPEFMRAVRELSAEGKTHAHGYVDVHEAIARMHANRAAKLPPPLPRLP